MAQLAPTLERLRWFPPLRPGRIVAVNLPAYRLRAFDTRSDAAVPLLEMRVIVGTAERTPTSLFIGEMRYLEINPYWNVPRGIEVGEIVPKLVRNGAYLRQNDMELVCRRAKSCPRELFNRTRRDLSHGCIRVEHPDELAQFVLPDASKWNAESLKAEIRSSRTRTVTLLAPGCGSSTGNPAPPFLPALLMQMIWIEALVLLAVVVLMACPIVPAIVRND
ncbi:L,D-transpeptidase family protein [Massilia aerilata]|uniref:L,D-transpeptidase family protein n=1 Tax=Massilia aerilata TaxID=453817 RepID=A0ABW0RZZ0_9BURK